MKARVNGATLRRLAGQHDRCQDALCEIGDAAENVRRALGVSRSDQNALDHIADFCGGSITPMALLERLGIATVAVNTTVEAQVAATDGTDLVMYVLRAIPNAVYAMIDEPRLEEIAKALIAAHSRRVFWGIAYQSVPKTPPEGR